MCSHFSLRIEKHCKCELEKAVFSADRKRGEISERGVTWLHGTALFDVMKLLVRGVFVDIAHEFAFFGVLPGILRLFTQRVTTVTTIITFEVAFAFRQFMADEIG